MERHGWDWWFFNGHNLKVLKWRMDWDWEIHHKGIISMKSAFKMHLYTWWSWFHWYIHSCLFRTRTYISKACVHHAFVVHISLSLIASTVAHIYNACISRCFMFIMAENLLNNAHNGLECMRVSLSPLIVDYCAEDWKGPQSSSAIRCWILSPKGHI